MASILRGVDAPSPSASLSCPHLPSTRGTTPAYAAAMRSISAADGDIASMQYSKPWIERRYRLRSPSRSLSTRPASSIPPVRLFASRLPSNSRRNSFSLALTRDMSLVRSAILAASQVVQAPCPNRARSMSRIPSWCFVLGPA